MAHSAQSGPVQKEQGEKREWRRIGAVIKAICGEGWGTGRPAWPYFQTYLEKKATLDLASLLETHLLIQYISKKVIRNVQSFFLLETKSAGFLMKDLLLPQSLCSPEIAAYSPACFV